MFDCNLAFNPALPEVPTTHYVSGTLELLPVEVFPLPTLPVGFYHSYDCAILK